MVRDRIDKLRALMRAEGLDGMLLIDQKDRRWATGFASSDGGVLVTEHETFFFTDSRYIEAARLAVRDATVGLVSPKMPMREWLRQAAADCGVKRLGFEEDRLTWADTVRYRKMLPEAEFVGAASLVRRLRAEKDSDELAAMKKAQAVTDAVFTELLDIIRPGVSEREIAAEITYRQLLRGAEGNSFDPIVVTGRKSSMPHGVPGGELIQKGDFVTMDFGCVVDGYCSDMTRTVAVGEPTDEMRAVYDIVLRAQEAGMAAARAGVTGESIDAAGRGVIADAGYGECFGHSFGHSLGLDIHESPSASPSEKQVMPVGAVVSAEPGIYIAGRFDVRIEDVLYLSENGCEDLTNSPKNLIVL